MNEHHVRQHVAYKRNVGELDPDVAARMLAALNRGADPNYSTLLHAATFLDPPSVVYHSAPRSARASIEATGLRASSPASGRWGRDAAGQPAGVYVTARPDVIGVWVHDDEWDVWEIQRGELTWGHDTLNPGCWWLESVPANAIRRVPRCEAAR